MRSDSMEQIFLCSLVLIFQAFLCPMSSKQSLLWMIANRSFGFFVDFAQLCLLPVGGSGSLPASLGQPTAKHNSRNFLNMLSRNLSVDLLRLDVLELRSAYLH